MRVIARSRADALRRSSARNASSSAMQSTSYAQLLRSRAAQSTVVPDVPYVPLQDDWYAYEDMFEMKGMYEDRASEAVRKDREGIMRAGGYRVEDAWERALRSAVAGLDLQPLLLELPVGDIGGDIIMASAGILEASA
jgi:CDK-activating kinase assembly factor MAT1